MFSTLELSPMQQHMQNFHPQNFHSIHNAFQASQFTHAADRFTHAQISHAFCTLGDYR